MKSADHRNSQYPVQRGDNSTFHVQRLVVGLDLRTKRGVRISGDPNCLLALTESQIGQWSTLWNRRLRQIKVFEKLFRSMAHDLINGPKCGFTAETKGCSEV